MDWEFYPVHDWKTKTIVHVPVNVDQAVDRCVEHARSKGVRFLWFLRVRLGGHLPPAEWYNRPELENWVDLECVYECVDRTGRVVQFNVPYQPLPWQVMS